MTAGNRSLRDRLMERDRLTEENGCYYGIRDLRLKQQDPVKYERFTARLVSAALSSREAAKYVAASPAARVMGEEVFALATPEGDVTAISMGLQGHISSMPHFIRHMIERGYEVNPGFRPGDVFLGNDPRISSPHGSDVYCAIPVFWEEELVAWSIGVNHITDIGAMDASSVPVLSPTSFTDGLLLPPMKGGENFEHYPWVYDLWNNRTRAGGFNTLDEKMRLAGCTLLHDRVREILTEFGIDYFRQALREWVEDGRRYAEQMIRDTMIPGRYRSPAFRTVFQKGAAASFSFANRNYLQHIYGCMTVTPEGRILDDEEGSSSWGYHSANAYLHGAVWGSFFTTLRNHLIFDPKVNTGVHLQATVTAPKGSMMNPDYPFTSVSSAWSMVVAFSNSVSTNIARSQFYRGFLEESWAENVNTLLPTGSGILEDGSIYSFISFENAANMATGASGCQDGESYLYSYVNAQSDAGDPEDWEYIVPTVFYLNRNTEPNTCGNGKYRGGLASDITLVAIDQGRNLRISAANIGSDGRTGGSSCSPVAGLPGAGCVMIFLHGTNMRDLMARSVPYPRSWAETREYLANGTLTAATVAVWKGGMPEVDVADGDLLVFLNNAGSGWGDPLERNPSRCSEDARGGDLTPERIRDVYGVLVQPDQDMAVDAAATDILRESKRQERRAEAVPVRQWWSRTRNRIQAQDFKVPEVRDMHADCMRYPRYREDFIEFWQLGDDYKIGS